MKVVFYFVKTVVLPLRDILLKTCDHYFMCYVV